MDHIPKDDHQRAALFQILDRIKSITGEVPIADVDVTGTWAFPNVGVVVRFSLMGNFIFVRASRGLRASRGHKVDESVAWAGSPTGVDCTPLLVRWNVVEECIREAKLWGSSRTA